MTEKNNETVLAEAVSVEIVVAEKLDIIEFLKLYKKRIPIKILKDITVLHEFLEGRKITVLRSSGVLEHGWEITQACYQYFVIKPYLDTYSWSFQVKKDNLTKVIKLDDLKMSLDEEHHFIVDDLIEIFDLNANK